MYHTMSVIASAKEMYKTVCGSGGSAESAIGFDVQCQVTLHGLVWSAAAATAAAVAVARVAKEICLGKANNTVEYTRRARKIDENVRTELNLYIFNAPHRMVRACWTRTRLVSWCSKRVIVV